MHDQQDRHRRRRPRPAVPQDQRGGGRRSRAHHRNRARRGQGHRLRPERLLLSRRRRRSAAARPVARHRHGRRRQEKEGRGKRRRRRPGHDVRLRLHRERGLREGLVHAGADLLRAQDSQGAVGKAPRQAIVRPAAGRQEPGDGAICRRQAGRLHQGRGLDAAQCAEPQRQEIHPGHGQGFDRRRGGFGAAERLDAEEGRPTSW